MMFVVLVVGLVSACFAQESLTSPPEEDRFPAEETFLPDDSPITPDELASPPAGEFKKVFLRDLVSAKRHITALLAHLQSKGDSVNPLAIMQANALIQGLDKALTTRSLQDALALDELYDSAWLVWRWDSVHARFDYFDKFGFLMFYCFEHINEQNGGLLSDEIARKFVHVFYAIPKVPWESEGVDGHRSFSKDSLWICNPLAVSETLKEWDMNGIEHLSCVEALEWLGESGSLTLPVLRARYQAAPGPFDAALAEYRNWALTALDATPPADEISKRDVIALKRESARLGRLIALLEHGTTGKDHALFPRLKSYKESLDHLASTAKIADVKDLILAMDPFEAEWAKINAIKQGSGTDEGKNAAIAALGLPKFFFDVERLSGDHDFGHLPGHIGMDLHSDYLEAFVNDLPAELFGFEYRKTQNPGFIQDQNSADLFVLFPDLMVAKVKSLPLEERKRILEYKGDLLDTPAKFFAEFADEPDKHSAIVIARYQAHKAEMDANYAALVQWHKEQPAGQ